MSLTVIREALKHISQVYGIIPEVRYSYYRKDKMIFVCEGGKRFWYNFATGIVGEVYGA